MLENIKAEHAVAGLSGALAYIPFVKQLTHWLAIVIPIVGLLCAVFLTPLTVSLLKRYNGIVLNVEEQSGLAFMIGFSAMVMILPMVLRAINKLTTTLGGHIIQIVSVEHPPEEKP